MKKETGDIFDEEIDIGLLTGVLKELRETCREFRNVNSNIYEKARDIIDKILTEIQYAFGGDDK